MKFDIKIILTTICGFGYRQGAIRMKKIFFAVLMILFAATVTAQAAEPVRIARLPIIFKCKIPDDGTRETLEQKIEMAVHIPLNGTAQWAEYLSPIDSVQTFNELRQEISAIDKRARFADAIRPLAEKIDADIIICPIVHQYGQFVVAHTSGPGSESILQSCAQVELIVYDRRTDDLRDKKVTRTYRDEWSKTGTALHLASYCFDRVISETKLRELIQAIGKD